MLGNSFYQILKSLFRNPLNTASFITFVFLVSFNPFKIQTHYGNGGGKWIDQIDSYSEYLVRNKIKNDILGTENRESFLVITKGYSELDFNYVTAGTKKYFSQFSLQSRLLSILARLLGLNNSADIDLFCNVFRYLNAIFFSMSIALFFLVAFKGNSRPFIITLLFLCFHKGFYLFAHNLYFASAIFSFPLLAMATLYPSVSIRSMLPVVFFSSLANFLCRYEFASIYCLLWVIGVFVLYSANPFEQKIKISLIIFSSTVLAFLISVIVHVSAVQKDTGLNFSQSKDIAFSTLKHRTQSVDGVPGPFTKDFLPFYMARMSFSHLAFLILFGLSVFLGLKDLIVVFGIGFCSYLSWYVGAYQHIMWHGFYDPFLTGLSLVISSAYSVGYLAVQSHRLMSFKLR